MRHLRLTFRLRNAYPVAMRALLIAFVLVATPAAAQETAPQLNRASAAFLLGAGADWLSTSLFLQEPGNHEQNPVLGWASPQPAAVVTMGAAIDVAGLWAARRFATKTHHERLATIALYAAGAARGFLAYHNIRNMDTRAQITASNGVWKNQHLDGYGSR